MGQVALEAPPSRRRTQVDKHLWLPRCQNHWDTSKISKSEGLYRLSAEGLRWVQHGPTSSLYFNVRSAGSTDQTHPGANITQPPSPLEPLGAPWSPLEPLGALEPGVKVVVLPSVPGTAHGRLAGAYGLEALMLEFKGWVQTL